MLISGKNVQQFTPILLVFKYFNLQIEVVYTLNVINFAATENAFDLSRFNMSHINLSTTHINDMASYRAGFRITLKRRISGRCLDS